MFVIVNIKFSTVDFFQWYVNYEKLYSSQMHYPVEELDGLIVLLDPVKQFQILDVKILYWYH